MNVHYSGGAFSFEFLEFNIMNLFLQNTQYLNGP